MKPVSSSESKKVQKLERISSPPFDSEWLDKEKAAASKKKKKKNHLWFPSGDSCSKLKMESGGLCWHEY